MKNVIFKETNSTILVDSLMGTEIIAYRCPNSDSVCLLARVTKQQVKQYGFINLNYPNQDSAFVHITFYDAIRAAGKNRSIYAFSSQSELIEAIYKDQI